MQSQDRSGVAQDEPPAVTEDSIRRYLIEQVARRSQIATEEVDADRPLEEFGLASRDAVAIAGELEEMLGRSIPATLVWEHPTINRISAALTGGDVAAEVPAPMAAKTDEPVAVIGIGCRFPGGVTGAREYWDFLLAGGDAIREVPDGRWDAFNDGSPEVADALANVTRLGGFLDDIAAFDAQFFGITPREATLMDPQQRLVLEVAWEALEHAGIAPATLRGSRTGVFVGVSSPEYAAFTASDFARLEPFTATGVALSIIANRLSYLLDLRGPSMIVDTACSSSLVSTHLAAQALRAGEADVALAGGVNLLLSPTITMTFDQAGGTAPDGHCKPFDASADGMVRAEGCGVVVLKRLSDALRDGDRVLALIRGSGVNSDGRSNGLVAPNSDAQKALLRDVYARSGIDTREVDYVEAHGTGTFLGDPIEAKAMGEVLGAGRPVAEPLLIGSAKSNLGHMESAAGIAGLIKTILSLAHRTIPASIHYKQPNPHIPFEDLHLQVAAEETPWPSRGHAPRAGVSGFGFGGTNAHVILEAAPPSSSARPVAAPTRSYALSDTTADRIRDHAAVLADWAEAGHADLADIEHTLRRRNGRGRARSAVVARDRAGLVGGLRALAEGTPHPSVVSGVALAAVPNRPVWILSGYGSQRPGMAKSLLAEEPAFAEAIDDLDPLFAEEAGFSLWELLEDGFEAEDPARTMPVLFGIQIGLARMWASYGITPSAVIGHSMGEIAAAVIAGSLSLEDGVKVITRRSKLMMSLVGGGAMAVVGASAAEVADLSADCREVYAAVHSSPRQTVITGAIEQVEEVVARAAAKGLLARMVQAEGAGHSPQVDPLLPLLREELASVGLRPGTPLAEGIRLYTTALDDPRAEVRPDAEYWAANLRNPVRLTTAVTAAAEDGHRRFVELNVQPILSHAVGETLEEVPGTLVTYTLKRAPKGRPTDDTLTFHTQLAMLAVNGHRVLPGPDGALTDLPRTPWRHEHHWVAPRPAPRADEHPLLGAHVELPGEDRHVWSTDVGTLAQPWLAGRRVHGTAVLPAGALAEMALAAGSVALGSDAVRVGGLAIERLLPLTPHATVTTMVGWDRRVEIHAQTPAGTWARLATAEITSGDGTDAVTVASGGSPVRFAVDAAERGSRHYRLHPEVFDRCLRALAEAAATVEPGVWIPDSIGTLRAYRPSHRGGTAQVELTQTVHGPTGTVVLLDADGTILAEATGVVLRRVEHSDVPVSLSGKLVGVTWQETPLTDPGDRAGSPAESRVVLGDDVLGTGALTVDWDDLEASLRSALAEPPAHVVLAPPADLEDERLVLAIATAARTLADSTSRLWIVTRGALAVHEDEPGNPRQAFVRALVRVLGFEHPDLRATLLDLPLSRGVSRTESQRGAGNATGQREVLAELAAGAADSEVAYRGGVRYAARVEAAALHGEGAKPRKIVRRGGSYIITGGYGGIGLVTAELLAERGAGRIVLSGRSGPAPEAEKIIARLRESGVDIGIVLGDIAADGVAERLVAVAREDGVRLCGVVHGAAGMDDKLIADLGAEDLHRVWTPKVRGAWRLHEATEGIDLDFWLVHSSAAALLGSPGQGSYAAANAALDALVDHRRAHGLPATTINWGTWSQVGGAADLSVTVLDPISPAEGTEALEALLAFDRKATGVLRFDPVTALQLFPEITRMPYFAALVAEAQHQQAEEDGDWPGAEAIRALAPDEAGKLISERIRRRIATVLGFAPEHLDTSIPLTELGLDSLVAVRIKSAVEHDLGLTVPPAILLQGASVEGFEAWVSGELGLGATEQVVVRAEEGYVMPRDAAERLAVRIFEEVLGLERISVVAEFFELGGQDHQADEVVRHLTAELGCELNRTELFITPTAEHVAEVIRGAEEEAARQTVRPLQSRGSRLPFFSAHPAGGTTGVYQQLAALLGTGQPFFGLERFEDAPSVQERCARYVEHLREAQPEGPFRLGGWSFGGVLAYETARQLVAAGREVELVVLFDAGVPRPVADEADTMARRFSGFVEYLNKTYALDLVLTYDELAGLSEEAQFALVMERAAPVIEILPPAVLHHQLTSHQDTRSLEAWRPEPYDGRVVLYRAPEQTPWGLDIGERYALDETNGFGELCSNLEIVWIPGTHHLNLLDPPGVNLIAAHLGAELAGGAPAESQEELDV
ncbi:MAG TPA: SDR family NAD(P)-dependent oxidoreductase [Streptosporangiaceae bacterium]|nr:SDR family NAD(P)-dependent oxidoreductase [Streptosporangiaceae bacterium]